MPLTRGRAPRFSPDNARPRALTLRSLGGCRAVQDFASRSGELAGSDRAGECGAQDPRRRRLWVQISTETGPQTCQLPVPRPPLRGPHAFDAEGSIPPFGMLDRGELGVSAVPDLGPSDVRVSDLLQLSLHRRIVPEPAVL